MATYSSYSRLDYSDDYDENFGEDFDYETVKAAVREYEDGFEPDRAAGFRRRKFKQVGSTIKH